MALFYTQVKNILTSKFALLNSCSLYGTLLSLKSLDQWGVLVRALYKIASLKLGFIFEPFLSTLRLIYAAFS